MRREIGEEDYSNCWREQWDRLTSEFIKCEARQNYNEEGEEEFLALYRAGRLEELQKILSDDTQSASGVWMEAVRRDLRFIRLRVFELPLSEYLEFELEAYKIQAAAVEEIWMVERSALAEIPASLIGDFMVFDRHIALIPAYDAEDRLVGATVTDEKQDVGNLLRIASESRRVGQRLQDFLKEYGG